MPWPGRVLAATHRHAERAALEHAYTCEWAADLSTDPQRRRSLYTEGAATLRTFGGPGAAPLKPLRRIDLDARQARLRRLAGETP